MIVVADTSPLNYLVLIGEIEILHRLFGEVVLPGLVLAEMRHTGAPEIVRLWAESPPSWTVARAATEGISFPRLGSGETEAIAVASAMRADLVLMDERKGRRVAQEHGLAVSGTIALLELAAQREFISLPEILEKLKKTSFHISERVLAETLARDREQTTQTHDTP